MPPTTPIQGFPKIAIVMANLIVEGINCGIHPFIVPTSDSHGMLRGVTSKRLPPRSGSSPLDFALTTFDNVLLDPSAFLGTSLSPPLDRQAALHKSIWRIGIGSMALAVTTISAFKMVACIGTEYSFRRHVRGKDTSLVPIISFRSQQLPVLYALAITAVLDAWRPKAVAILMSSSLDPRSRHGMAVIFKATTCRLLTSSAREVGERLGAQGTFGHNLVSQIEVPIHS
jgi:acyl-CoA oxidase